MILLLIALNTITPIMDVRGEPMRPYDHCADSGFQVGDANPWGTVEYISVIKDQGGQVVGWVYLTDRARMFMQANTKMSMGDRSYAGIYEHFDSYPTRMSQPINFFTNVWPDLSIGPCTDIQHFKPPGSA